MQKHYSIAIHETGIPVANLIFSNKNIVSLPKEWKATYLRPDLLGIRSDHFSVEDIKLFPEEKKLVPDYQILTVGDFVAKYFQTGNGRTRTSLGVHQVSGIFDAGRFREVFGGNRAFLPRHAFEGLCECGHKKTIKYVPFLYEGRSVLLSPQLKIGRAKYDDIFENDMVVAYIPDPEPLKWETPHPKISQLIRTKGHSASKC